MNKYNVDDGHWESEDTDEPPAWKADTSATVKFDVTLHQEGYQNDRKWTVLLNDRDDEIVGVYGVEHRNKGNFWRRKKNTPENCIDFVDLPKRVKQRVAHVVNRDIEAITPEHRAFDDDTQAGDGE